MSTPQKKSDTKKCKRWLRVQQKEANPNE